MSKIVPVAVAGVALLVSVSAVQAQLFGGRRDAPPPVPQSDQLDPALCDQIVNIPNSPMSAEACRSMMKMQQSMKAASSDPSAIRPGDESMTCDQITAEMIAVARPMVSPETVAQARESADAQLALRQKQDAEAKAFVAQQMAITMGAGALGLVPGGGYAASAIAAGQQAQAQALAQRQQAEAAPVYAQSSRSIVATTTEMSQAMQSNPRFARLMQMTAQKNCPPPPDAVDPRR
jgi:hypothetical protein